MSEKWLNAHYDPVASLTTFTQCMELTDVSGDGDTRLIVADLGKNGLGMKLKVYKGTALLMENTIIDLPTSVKSFYLDQNEPRTPAVAVASGPFIYIYKNMRPFFKFTLPALEVNVLEEEAWNSAKDGCMKWRQLKEILENYRNDGIQLSARSHYFLKHNSEESENFFNLHINSPLKNQTVITCMDTLNKCSSDLNAISCLVFATESKHIYVLESEAFTVLSKMELPSVPVFLSVSGIYDVEFKIFATCRNGTIYQLKRGMKSVLKGIELNQHPIGMVRPNKNIIVGCMDDTLRSYNLKGKKLWSIKMPSVICAMAPFIYPTRGIMAVIVSLEDLTVRIYKDKYLLDSFTVEDVVVGIVFGRYGREDGALLMSTRGGGLIVKLLKRSAEFVESAEQGGPPIAQFSRINVPHKTKLYVDQTLREREYGVAMHRQFINDLSRLRLNSARNFVEALETRMNPVSTNPAEPLKLSVFVQGIGPTFRLTASLQNTSMTNATQNLLIVFSYDVSIYTIDRACIEVAYLVPGVNYNYSSTVKCINDKGVANVIKVFVVKQGKDVPIITGIVNMPVSESTVIV